MEASQSQSKTISTKSLELGGKVRKVRLDKILVRDRYRKDYGNLQELADSISRFGQLQNLVLESFQTPIDGKLYELRAGGRRFAAMSEILNLEEANALVFPRKLSELEALEVELAENRDRKDMDWKEIIALTKQIHNLQVELYGEKVAKAPDAPGWSMRDTAKKVGQSIGTVSQDVALASAVEAMPELFENAKTKSEAKKILSIAQEQAVRTELAKRIETQKLSANSNNNGKLAKISNLLDRFIIRDFFEGVLELPEKSFNFVEIDPPYGIRLNQQKSRAITDPKLDAYNEIPEAEYREFLRKTISETNRVLATNSWGLIWYAPEWRETILTILRSFNFQPQIIPGVWVKPNGQNHQPDRQLTKATEEFIYFRKGDAQLARLGRTNVFPYTPISPTKKYHPTEKPLELYEDILQTFCFEGSKILIPFLGSGKAIIAADKLKMNAFGYEISNIYREGYICLVNELYG